MRKILKSLLLLGMLTVGACVSQTPDSDTDLSARLNESPYATFVIDIVRAAEGGDKNAQVRLSQIYLGEIEQLSDFIDKEKGIYWLERFAANDPTKQYLLGEAYHFGNMGVDQNLETALLWYKRAAVGGNAHAMDYIGYFYETGKANLDQSCEKAIYWFKQSIEKGYEFAANNLAWLYATCVDERYRDGFKAIEIVLGLLQKGASPKATLLDTLAAAYAETGDFDSAVKTQTEAISLLDRNDSEVRYATHLQKLEKYKNEKKWVGMSTDAPELLGE